MNDRRSALVDTTRRRVLRAVGSGALVAGVAGCSQLEGDEGETTAEAEPADDGTTETETETERETDAETATERDGEDREEEGSQGDEKTETEGTADDGAPSFGACSLSDGDLTAECDDPTVVDSDVSEDLTLGEECDRILVTRWIEVEGGATLTVEPGTRLTFEENAGIYVRSDSALNAAGTCEEPIRFSGAEPVRGHWHGVVLRGTDQTENVLRHVTIEHGGADLPSATLRGHGEAANLNVLGSRVAIERCTFRDSARFGVTVKGSATSTAVKRFEESLVTENAIAAYTQPTTTHALSATSSFVGNDDDRVTVESGTVGGEMSVAWDAIDARYVPTGHVELQGDLEIRPGATVSFGEDTWLEIRDGARLVADGEDPETGDVDEITFTAEDERRGHWKGLIFYGANQSANVLRHATVEYAGGSLPNATLRNRARPADLVVHSSRLTVEECTFRESLAWGVSIRGGDSSTTIERFDGNALTENGEGAAYVHAFHAHYLSDSSDYTGNDEDRVHVNTTDIDDDVTWDDLGVRYVVDGKVQVNGVLTVSPGATVSFERGGALYVYGGSVTAEGIDPDTEEIDEITFTAEDELAGYWNGIVFYRSFSSDNVLRHVVVEYGGDTLWSATQRYYGSSANVVLSRGSRAVVENSTVRHSAGHGIHAAGEDLIASGNTFADIEGEEINR